VGTARRHHLLALAALLALVGFACSSSIEEGVEITGETRIAGSVFDVLDADGRFSNLVEGANVAETGVADVLKDGLAVTIFAPTDDAFTEAMLESLIEDPEGLAELLNSHVVEGRIESADLGSGELTSLAGGALTFDGSGSTLNDISIVETDLPATNGVIHVLDSLLVPEG